MRYGEFFYLTRVLRFAFQRAATIVNLRPPEQDALASVMSANSEERPR